MKLSKPDKASSRRQAKAAEALRNAKEVSKHKNDSGASKKKLSVAALR